MIYLDLALSETLTSYNTNNQTTRMRDNLTDSNSMSILSTGGSSGISGTAELIQDFFKKMLICQNAWKEAVVLTTPDDVEKEIVVILPPNDRQQVKLRIINAHRPDPLIFTDY